ncbi:MAG: response regulator, partial [Anaerolineales bacterium]|nr:response regulator [Anaerolineales bacterium]
GIAHDFNNMLVPIIGYAELGQMQLTPDSKIYTNLGRIKHAAGRAAGLTKQILAFSRRQVLEMKTLDLNEVVNEFREMIERLVGENIDLQIHLAAGLPPIRADKGQLEQVLLNLVVNARDAMPRGGKLIIETARITLDESYAMTHLGAQPGPRVMLAVSDTGQGMDTATQQHIFEPFFTTKGRGQGTGLGLATVFGIIKQHDGNIWVYSEPGHGTVFKIYLPLTEAANTPQETEYTQIEALQGRETVLIVEDEATVRQLVEETLRAQGYQVLVAENGDEGLALATVHKGTLHLLLTDVVLPDMDGRALYSTLTQQRPQLKVLYMSGYTDSAIIHYTELEDGVAFLQKPFTIHNLLRKLRGVLEKSIEG